MSDPAPVGATGVTDVESALEGIPFGRMGGEEISLGWALRLLRLDFWSEPFPPQEWPHLSWVSSSA